MHKTTDNQLIRRVHVVLRNAGFYRFANAEKRYKSRLVTEAGRGGQPGLVIVPYYKQALSIPDRAKRAQEVLAALKRAGIGARIDSMNYVFVSFD